MNLDIGLPRTNASKMEISIIELAITAISRTKENLEQFIFVKSVMWLYILNV